MAQLRRPSTAEPSSAVKKRDPTYHHFNIEYRGATCPLKVKVEQRLVGLRPNAMLFDFLTFADILAGFHLEPAAHIIEISLFCCTDGRFERRVIIDIKRKVSDIISTFDRKATHPVLYINFSNRWLSDMRRTKTSIAGEAEKAIRNLEHASFEQVETSFTEICSKCRSAWREANRVLDSFENLIEQYDETSSLPEELRSMHGAAVQWEKLFWSQWHELCCQYWSSDVMQREFRIWNAHDVRNWLQYTSDGAIDLSEMQAQMKWITGARLADVCDARLRDAGVRDAETRKLILDRIRSLLDEYGSESEEDDEEEDDEDEKAQEENKLPRHQLSHVASAVASAARPKTEQELKDRLRHITLTADRSFCREFTLLVIHIDDFNAFKHRPLLTGVSRILGQFQKKSPEDWKKRRCDIKALHVFYRGDNQFAILVQHPSEDKARASLQIMYDQVKGAINRLRVDTFRVDTREGPLRACVQISVGAFTGDYNEKADDCDKWLAYANDAAMRVRALKDKALDDKAKVKALEHLLRHSNDTAMKLKALRDRSKAKARKDSDAGSASSLWIRDLAQHEDKHIAEFRFYDPQYRK